jgi:hypothetical protein
MFFVTSRTNRRVEDTLLLHTGRNEGKDVTFGAILILFLASVIHSWYAGNASLPYGQGAGLYREHGGFVLAVSVLLLRSRRTDTPMMR